MTKNLIIATQMDPLQSVDIATDSSFAMLEEAQSRGHINYIYQPEHLSYVEGRVLARARKVIVSNKQGDHADIGEEELLDLGQQTDVVLMRQDPPFDMSYITAAHLLELLEGETLVVNNPKWVRSSPEKLFPLLFADLMPPTLISRDEKAIAAFRQQHKDIIIKPLYGNGGAGIFRIKQDDSNYSSLLETFFAMSREPVMVQAFLPAVAKGDKRIILIDGELAGGFNRIPQKGETRSNLHIGGTAAAVDLSKRDLEICKRIGPELKKRGLLFVGIDVIGGYLTEINVTSPTGVRELEGFTGVNAIKLMWDAIEGKIDA
ncbi:MAG: glutathione synthase [Robiginitomaculum sp.]|nr:glutathione synthase [Robiginitomaculum sp.]